MRKFQHEKVLELVKTLNEAHRELMRLHVERNNKLFVGLLADCQEFAVQIGNYVEGIEGEGTATVALLEEYCDTLYFTSIETHDGSDNASAIKRLREQLGKIEDKVKSELMPNKIEIAFLPYKASMWDSCESVWLEAKDDPQCDAYVVPIPYYDRMPGGTLGHMHYEGNQFPDYVPIVNWQSYNIEERRPDVIVTINPYDDNNLVTMVHPNYFNKRLKDLTEQLVYIPYFVSMDKVEEHFCTCAGVLFADRVIVQSDKIRDTYIRVLKQFEQANRCIGRFGNVEEKIVALGSPKFDKVVNTKREYCVVPDEWRKLIERTDGTSRKVVLYNTSLAVLLEGGEKVLNKLRNVFDRVEQRDDVVLLWRPHPLSQSTYQSMRPQLREEYERFVQQYKQRQIGIYDDTADLHRAIAISDAYYGDMGSLVSLYACTGKPIMVQWIDHLPLTDKSVRASIILDDDQYWWVSVYDFNGLFRVDKHTMIAEYMGSFEEENTQFLYLDAVEQDRKFYFAPFNADHIAIYDKEKSIFEQLSFQNKEKLNWLRPGENEYFNRVIRYKRYLFFVAHMYPAIICYDTTSGEMTYCSDWLGHVEHAAKRSPHWLNWDQTNDFDGLFCPGGFVVGSEIVLSLYMSNELMFFDMETLTYQFYKVGKQDERFFGVCYDGEHYWLAARKGNYIVKWKRETQSYAKIEFPEYVIDGNAVNYQAVIYAGGFVWLIPHEASTALKIDISNNSFHKASELDLPETGKSIAYFNVKQFGDTVYALTRNRVLQWDTRKHQHKLHQFSISNQNARSVMRARMAALRKQPMQSKNLMELLHNEARISLDTFLDYVVQFNHLPFALLQSDKQIQMCSQIANNMDGTSGRAIYELSKQLPQAGGGGKR
ncbi:hypothetical protein [Cohnella lupini]|uniref:CDP-glycerol:poly(Glycerophosphate) glycerophosphotransferase n=1 Tax=Cohnella lupini TaxID=1294267 RepID=A0A3D9I736_9BACL|nr:hypothetical protein [Cohnella lupini]RED57593.1 hypothetical protein DFP95_11066 [Cohnella lupini]